jgi:hypothetical protein
MTTAASPSYARECDLPADMTANVKDILINKVSEELQKRYDAYSVIPRGITKCSVNILGTRYIVSHYWVTKSFFSTHPECMQADVKILPRDLTYTYSVSSC